MQKTIPSCAASALLALLAQGLSSASAQSYLHFEAGQTVYDVARFGSTDASSVGDVDGDGDPDLVLVNSTRDSLVLLYNDGDGGFVRAAADRLARRVFPIRWVKLADFDQDGDLDILTPNEDTTAVWIYANDGRGSFAGPTLALPHGAAALTLADVDGDKTPDVLLSAPSSGWVSELVLYLGDGKGGYTRGPALPQTEFYTDGLHVVDFDADGDKDIITTASRTFTKIFAQTSKGVWVDETGARWPGRDGTGSVTPLDFDADGDLDFAAIFGTKLRFFLNDGKGQLATEFPVPALSAAPLGIFARDFDDDGDTDFFLPSLQSAPVFLVRNGASLAVSDQSWFADVQGTHAIPGDFDQDGDIDLYLTELRGILGPIERVHLNQRRSLRANEDPRIGADWPLVLRDRRAPANALRVVLYATRELSERVPVAPFGRLALDPSTIFAARPATGFLNGEARVELAIPDDARLRGLDIYAQALLGPSLAVQDARLSARVTRWIR